jgi:hypothetical protein
VSEGPVTHELLHLGVSLRSKPGKSESRWRWRSCILRPMDQFRAEWKSMKRDVERQLALLGPPSGMRTTDENGKDTTKASKERLGRIIKELDELLKAHELSPNRRAE